MERSQNVQNRSGRRWERSRNDKGGENGGFGGHFGIVLGVILGSFWPPGVLLGRFGGPRRVPRVSKSVKMSILKLFNNFKELLERSKSVQNRSGRRWERSRSDKGGENGGFGGHFGVVLGSFWGPFWGHFGGRKVSSKKRVEKVKIVFSCRRHADF